MKTKSCKVIAEDKIEITYSDKRVYIQGIRDHIIRCVHTEGALLEMSPLGIEKGAGAELKLKESAAMIEIETSAVRMLICKDTGRTKWIDLLHNRETLKEAGSELRTAPLVEYSTGGEEPVIRTVQTVDGERNFVENLKPVETGSIYKAKLLFEFGEDESIHGLGQGEEGIYNYRRHMQYLYQHNMRIPIPFLLSSAGYGILFDATSLMTFNDDERGSYVYLDAVTQLDYYVIIGRKADTVIGGYRALTGKAVMLPKYAFGYVQSKEAYHTQDEVVSIAKEYRRREIPLDLIVQDWNTWEDGKWGNKKVDKARYPDLAAMNQELHDLNVHSMVSIWPNMNGGTEDNKEMKSAGYLLNDYCTYDAFNEDARALYWKQANEELFAGGFDSWWCDSTEPFSGPDWNGAYLREPWERFGLVGEEHKKFLGAKQANFYAALHARGIYENQRKTNPNKRVLNLTRSGYASIQKYGAVLWSGDIKATWLTMKQQIAEGLNMAMSGIPYWTLDIGAFFVVNENWRARGCNCNTDPSKKWFWQGDYEAGIEDLGYRELYVRWFEYGAFLPMFRSHGTDTPREVWQFGEPGGIFYDALIDMIQLRYRLMPYIYSLAAGVYFDDDTMMRSLLFDFNEDRMARENSTQFMLGRYLMICPVTEPMYYERDSKKIEADKQWSCYLPEQTQWIHLHTQQRYAGGQCVTVSAPLGKPPIFIRAGAIIPMEKGQTYANEQVETPFEIHIYSGCDAQFYYYEDGGDGYDYEKGVYNRIEMKWNESEGLFIIGQAPCQEFQGISGRMCRVICGEKQREFLYEGDEMEICL